VLVAFHFRMWLKHILLLCAVLALVLVKISAKKHHHNKYGREHNKKHKRSKHLHKHSDETKRTKKFNIEASPQNLLGDSMQIKMKGSDGIDGADGPEGDVGPVGPAGPPGVDGLKGEQGVCQPSECDYLNIMPMVARVTSLERYATEGGGGMNGGTEVAAPEEPGTGLGGGAGFGAGALNSMVQVSDRPVTRQGLGGMKTQSQGPQRMVQDKSYWLGLLRSKISELNTEVTKLTKEIGQFNQENASYVSYEKKAEMLAGEVKDLQGELADYNTIVDKLNTNSGFDDLEEDRKMLKQQNERESNNMERLFSQNQEKDKVLKQLEKEIDRERRMTESVVADMDPSRRQKFAELKSRNLTLQEELEYKQQQLDTLNEKIDNMEEEISQSNVKQEAVSLYERIMELEEKRNSLVDEVKTKESPTEERERLLKQVKDDNQEIARMENRTKEILEKAEKLQDDIGQMDMDLEEHHGERTAKYKELKKRDENMQEFLDSFDSNTVSAQEKQNGLEESIVQLLERISRADVQSKHMPSTHDFQQMQDDLNFKENEMAKSRDTATGLNGEHARLQGDLEKVEQLENKISTELNNLKLRIVNMNEELVKYSDLDALKKSANEKKKSLETEKATFKDGQAKMKEEVQELSTNYEQMKATLEDNETYAQLGNLERKWQHLEQNNFAMKEYINQKSSESNYVPLKDSVSAWVDEINQQLIQMNASSNR